MNTLLSGTALLLSLLNGVVMDPPEGYAPQRHVLQCQGKERTYFTVLPRNFDPAQTYWPLVAIHGGGGKAEKNTQPMMMWNHAEASAFPVIFILPNFDVKDKQLSRFPALGEDAFLKAVLEDARTQFKLHEKILLTGYSMGGQLSHRFALAHPEMVQACATSAAGTWTTPDGRLLIEEYGEVKNPAEFLGNPENAKLVPERLRDLFDARTAAVAGLPAAKGAEAVPYLVMCGTLDPRKGITEQFVASLEQNGYQVDTGWPETPHSSDEEKYRAEFDKYCARAVAFFQQHAK